ncbi:hypothetical protein AB0B67_07745 [Streptomyces spectabilis]|uniref:DUF308 domain-containing protein n=1 Tax=Streptomyces spectabilis TaxID=68270 RepID=A0A5P2X350_STRST|nr:hypothetical protein [Streptomyces spectabilis]MCI3902047.1 hypothetical protein [Streptomyces spectabilis]QEV59443.1 hypothetical protein CP982_12455 [Streptomyces spectabilis]
MRTGSSRRATDSSAGSPPAQARKGRPPVAEQQDRDESREPDERAAPPGEERAVPLDEDAAWRAIVAGYGEEPADPPGAKPFKSVEDLALLETEANGTPDDEPRPDLSKDTGDKTGGKPGDKSGGDAARPLGSSVSFAPGVGGAGPRDYTGAEPSDDDFDEGDEGHFVPPEPPPLPDADVTAKFAWLAVIGGPLLLLLAVLLGWQMTWWLTTIGIGGFLGGFATLVARMKSGDDEENDDPGRGAVV